tara:strand:+ start:7263 stop:7820 length:558 start_codon:yes stop_codon:yes gene_type:complete
MAAAIPILGVASTLAPLIGKGIAALGPAGQERRAMLREAVERRKTGDYGMSAAEKRQMKQDLVGLPGPADMTGNVGGATGPLSGALAKKLQEKWKARRADLATAGGKVAEISQADAERQALADQKRIEDAAAKAATEGAEIASTVADAGVGVAADVAAERKLAALKDAGDLIESAAAKAAAEGVA